MTTTTAIFEEVRGDLDLIEEHLRDWNRTYFAGATNRYRHNLEMIEKYHEGGEILELGAIPCHLTAILKRLGYDVVGVDLDPERGRAFIDKYGLEVVQCNIEREPLPFADGRFGFVLFNEIFEHLRIDPLFTLGELARVTKPGGTLMLTTPNLYAAETVYRFLRGRGFNDPVAEFEKLHTIGHMGHVREYAPREVARFLRRVGFKVRETEFISPEPWNEEWARAINLLHKRIPKLRSFQVVIARKTD